MLTITRNWFYSLLLPLFFCLVSCSKDGNINQGQNDKNLIGEAQKWYAATPHATGEPEWSEAKISNNQKAQPQIVVSYPLKAGVNEGNRTIRQMIFRKKNGVFEAYVRLIIADSLYGRSTNGLKAHDFTGQVAIYDLSRKLISGGYYEKGTLKRRAIFETYRDPDAFEKRAQTEMQCNYYQYSYVDDDGVFTVVGYSICTLDQGELPAIDHWEPEDTGGGGGVGTPWDPNTRSTGVACASFVFTPGPGTSNWQEAGVSGLFFDVRTTLGDVIERFPFRTIYVYAARVQANGKPLTPGLLAEQAANAATLAGSSLELEYRGTVPSPSTPMDVIFKQKMQNYLSGLIGGNATVSFKPANPGTVVKPVVWIGQPGDTGRCEE